MKEGRKQELKRGCYKYFSSSGSQNESDGSDSAKDESAKKETPKRKSKPRAEIVETMFTPKMKSKVHPKENSSEVSKMDKPEKSEEVDKMSSLIEKEELLPFSPFKDSKEKKTAVLISDKGREPQKEERKSLKANKEAIEQKKEHDKKRRSSKMLEPSTSKTGEQSKPHENTHSETKAMNIKKKEKIVNKKLTKIIPDDTDIMLQELYKKIQVTLIKDKFNEEGCLELLTQLENVDFSYKYFSRVPDLFVTIRNARKYKNSERIRSKAGDLYIKYKNMFIAHEKTTSNATGKPMVEENDEMNDASVAAGSFLSAITTPSTIESTSTIPEQPPLTRNEEAKTQPTSSSHQND